MYLLSITFRTQQFDALQLIAVDLTSTSDPALIQKCARFFVENNQFDKAVDLLAVGKMVSLVDQNLSQFCFYFIMNLFRFSAANS